jgi:hypothetical protein
MKVKILVSKRLIVWFLVMPQVVALLPGTRYIAERYERNKSNWTTFGISHSSCIFREAERVALDFSLFRQGS